MGIGDDVDIHGDLMGFLSTKIGFLSWELYLSWFVFFNAMSFLGTYSDIMVKCHQSKTHA